MKGRFKKGNIPWNKGIHWRKGIKNSSRAINYCYRCSFLLQDYFTGSYDETFGSKIIGRRCENVFCNIGCGNIGHIWGKLWKFQRTDKCQRCGLVRRNQ